MKTTLILSFLVVTAFSQSLWAQTSFHWGLTAGLTNSLLHHTYIPSNHKITTRWGYNAGVNFEHDLTPTLSLAYDMLYSRQGEVDTGTSPLGLGGYRIITSTDYLSLPLMLHYRPGGKRVWIGAGPQLGYLLNQKSYDPELKNVTTQHWALQDANRFDMGLTAGLGYQVSKHLLINSRYYLGLRPIFTPDAQARSEDIQKIYNRSWSLNVIYHF